MKACWRDLKWCSGKGLVNTEGGGERRRRGELIIMDDHTPQRLTHLTTTSMDLQQDARFECGESEDHSPTEPNQSLQIRTHQVTLPGTWGRYHGGRRPSSDDSFHSPTAIGTRQTECHEALPSSANVQSHLSSSFADDANAS